MAYPAPRGSKAMSKNPRKAKDWVGLSALCFLRGHDPGLRHFRTSSEKRSALGWDNGAPLALSGKCEVELVSKTSFDAHCDDHLLNGMSDSPPQSAPKARSVIAAIAPGTMRPRNRALKG